MAVVVGLGDLTVISTDTATAAVQTEAWGTGGVICKCWFFVGVSCCTDTIAIDLLASHSPTKELEPPQELFMVITEKATK